ncbi:MAG: TRAP transporter small permease subunit [Rhodospirillales bacterium]|nr:TRAP transporter small permease subunit [Rhodospirillales bacterium]
MERAAAALRTALEAICLVFLSVLLAVVVAAVVARYTGHVFGWYDEVASIILAWLTYLGTALAALRRGHLGFDNVMRAFPPRLRLTGFVVAEAVTIGFFLALGYGGWALLDVLVGETLVTIPAIPSAAVQSVIPLGAVLFIVAEILSMPGAWQSYVRGPALEEGHL